MSGPSRTTGHPAFLSILLISLLAGCAGHRHPPETAPPLQGLASWYGKKFQGRLTANGERFDMRRLTAAHRTLPFGTRVRVTNLENGRMVIVRINDRGPFVAGRIIDLSFAAGKKIGIIGTGVAPVRLEILKKK